MMHLRSLAVQEKKNIHTDALGTEHSPGRLFDIFTHGVFNPVGTRKTHRVTFQKRKKRERRDSFVRSSIALLRCTVQYSLGGVLLLFLADRERCI